MIKLNLLLFSIFLNFATVSALIIKAPSLDIIETYIEHLDQDSYVVFDVDYALLLTKVVNIVPSTIELQLRYREILKNI